MFSKSKKWYVVFALCALAAAVKYFYGLADSGAFCDDEYQTVGVAYGYMKSGTFNQWSWASNRISSDSYTRAWPLDY